MDEMIQKLTEAKETLTEKAGECRKIGENAAEACDREREKFYHGAESAYFHSAIVIELTLMELKDKKLSEGI